MSFRDVESNGKFHQLLFVFALLATVAESRNRQPSGPYPTAPASTPKWRRS